MKKLIPLRKKINNIDQEIAKLLKKRSYIIPKVRKIKSSWSYKIAMQREISMAKKIAKTDFGLYHKLFLQKIWRELISATLFIEGDLRVLVYKNPTNYFEIWELAKDHFSGACNLEISDNIPYLLDSLINQKAECLIFPDFKDADIKWWKYLLEEKYEGIKINLELPFIKGFKRLGTSSAFCISLNDKETFEDKKFYIINKTNLGNNDEINVLDFNDTHSVILSKHNLGELINLLKINKNQIRFIGSSVESILGY